VYTAYAETPLDEDETEAMAAEGRMRTGRMERFACSILPLWIAVAVGGCDSHGPAVSEARSPGEAGSQVVVEFSSELERPLESNYLLFLPSAYGEGTERSWPLILHLHGGGGRGTDPERMRPYPLVQRLDEEPDFPFVVVTPQCPPGRGGPMGDLWTEHADLVLAILDQVVASHRIDEDRVYLVGHSMGGYGTWYLGHLAPERFAAIVPIAGPGVSWWTGRIAKARVPVWVFHGELDDAVPVAESERMVAALRGMGGDVRFTKYPEVGHVLREPFEGDELFDWLLAQRRGQGETAD